jgi:hypothetical protein
VVVSARTPAEKVIETIETMAARIFLSIIFISFLLGFVGDAKYRA